MSVSVNCAKGMGERPMSVTCREHVGVRRGSLTWTIAARKPDEMVAWDRIAILGSTYVVVEAATRKSFGSYTEFTITTTSISSMYFTS